MAKAKLLDKLKFDPAKELERDGERNRVKADLKRLQAKLEESQRQNAELQRHLEAATSLGKRKPVKPLKPLKTRNKPPATAIGIFSDWHVEEVVKLEAVNGLNEYNPAVAESRAKNVTLRLVRMIEDSRGMATVRTLLLGLLGDFFSGWLHPELEQTNAMSPLEAVKFASHLLEQSIRTLLEHADIDRLEISDCVGNHGRNTKKQQHANRRETSLEQTMYDMLERIFAGDSRVVWRKESRGSYANVVDIAGHPIRLSHGDSIKYQGGIGGMTIPVLKQIHTRNECTRVEFDFFGHLHRFTPGTNWCCNGSLIGYSSYAAHIGAPFQPPLQTFALSDHERGMTRVMKLFCD